MAEAAVAAVAARQSGVGASCAATPAARRHAVAAAASSRRMTAPPPPTAGLRLLSLACRKPPQAAATGVQLRLRLLSRHTPQRQRHASTLL
jgi:hypothetical protein